jgi:predicted metal-binding membrane protein
LNTLLGVGRGKQITTKRNQPLLRRDHLAVLFSLMSITALAWLYLLGMQDMAGMGNAMLEATGISWAGRDFVLMFLMWAVMMVGMMVPSAFPMVLMFSFFNRNHRDKNGSFVSTSIFAAGYIVIWTAFSLAATIVQWGLQSVGLLSPMMVSTSVAFSGLVLVAAGIYQWTPVKNACLRNCQTPLGFLMTRWRDGVSGAFRMGLTHGAYCVGCCWILMGLLFVGGVMNLLSIAVLAMFVLLEKVTPPSPWLPRLTGTALIAWGGLALTVI